MRNNLASSPVLRKVTHRATALQKCSLQHVTRSTQDAGGSLVQADTRHSAPSRVSNVSLGKKTAQLLTYPPDG